MRPLGRSSVRVAGLSSDCNCFCGHVQTVVFGASCNAKGDHVPSAFTRCLGNFSLQLGDDRDEPGNVQSHECPSSVLRWFNRVFMKRVASLGNCHQCGVRDVCPSLTVRKEGGKRARSRFGKRVRSRFGKRVRSRFGKRVRSGFGKRVPLRSSERGSAHGSERLSTHGSERGPAQGSERGSAHGSERGSAHGSRFGKRVRARFGKKVR